MLLFLLGCLGFFHYGQTQLDTHVLYIGPKLKSSLEKCVDAQREFTPSLSIASILGSSDAQIETLATDSIGFDQVLHKVAFNGSNDMKTWMIKLYDPVDELLKAIFKKQFSNNDVNVPELVLQYKKRRQRINEVRLGYHMYISMLNKGNSFDHVREHWLKLCKNNDLKRLFDRLKADFSHEFNDSRNLAQVVSKWLGNDRLAYINTADWIKADICAAQFLLIACEGAKHKSSAIRAYESFRKSFIAGDKEYVQNAGDIVEKFIRDNIDQFDVKNGNCKLAHHLSKKFYWLKFAVAGYSTKSSQHDGKAFICSHRFIGIGKLQWVLQIYYWSYKDNQHNLVAQLAKIRSLIKSYGDHLVGPRTNCKNFDAQNWHNRIVNDTGILPSMVMSAYLDIPGHWDSTEFLQPCGDLIIPNSGDSDKHMIQYEIWKCASDNFGNAKTKVFFFEPPCALNAHDYP